MRMCWIWLGCCLTINALAETRGDRFYAIPPAVAPGAPVQLHWNVSEDVDASCAPSGGNGTIWAELGTLPAKDWEWLNAPRNSGRHVFTLHCDINGVRVQTSAEVRVRRAGASASYGPTRSPWQEVPAMAAAGLRAASRPVPGDNKLLFEVDGRLDGYTADDADRSALIYDPDAKALIPLQASTDRRPVPGSSVVSAIDISGQYPAAGNRHTLWWGHSLCSPAAPNCSSFLNEPLRGVFGMTSISTQTVVESPLVREHIYRPYVAFDSTNQELTDDWVIAQRNIYFMTDRGELAGAPQLVSKIGSNGIAFDGNSSHPVFTRQALPSVAALVFQTNAMNVLALQGVLNIEREQQICGMYITGYSPDHDSLFCVTRNRLSGAFGNADSVNPRAVTTVGNGVIVVFESEASNLVEGDDNGVSDVFAAARTYNGTVKGPVRLSVAQDGLQADGGSFAPSIAENGHAVVFESEASNLVDDDGNGLRDVYLLDLIEGRYERVSTAWDGGDADGPSSSAELSPDGRVMFRSKASDLLAQPMPDSDAIYFRQRLRHGGASRPSFSELPLTAGSDSACRGGYHSLVVSDGVASVHQDQNAYLRVNASEPDSTGTVGVLAAFARGQLALTLPESDSVRVAEITISAEGLVPSGVADVRVRSHRPAIGLFDSGAFTHVMESIELTAEQPLRVRANLRATDLSLQIYVGGSDRYVIQVQIEDSAGPLHFPLSASMWVDSGFDPHSKIGGLLGLCLDQPTRIDAKLDSSWRDELVTADLQLSIYDEQGVLRHRAPDTSR